MIISLLLFLAPSLLMGARDYKYSHGKRGCDCWRKYWQLISIEKVFQDVDSNIPDFIRLCEQKTGKTNYDHFLLWNRLAFDCQKYGYYKKAVEYGTKALQVLERLSNVKSYEYIIQLLNLSHYHYGNGEYSMGHALTEKAENLIKDVYKKDNVEHAEVLLALAGCKYEECNYLDALRIGKSSADMYLKKVKSISKYECSQYFAILEIVAACHSALGNYDEVLSVLEKSLFFANHGDDEDREIFYRVKADCYYKLGQYHESITACETAIEIYSKEEARWELLTEKTNGKKSIEYVKLLNIMALCYVSLGQYDNALFYFNQILDIYTKIDNSNTAYASVLNNMAQCYYYNDEIEEAKNLLEIAKGVFDKLVVDSPDKATCISNLAYIYRRLGYNAKAMDLESTAFNQYKEIFGDDNVNLTSSFLHFSQYCYDEQRYVWALDLSKRAYDICKKNCGETHPYTAFASSVIASCCLALGDKFHGEMYTDTTRMALNSIIRNTFSYLTAYERSQFWEKYKSWYERLSHVFSYRFNTQRLVSNGYGASLVHKGLLLHSELEFSRLIDEAKDAHAKEIYEDLNLLKRQINKLKERPRNERFANVDSLEEVAQKKEKELQNIIGKYGNYTKNLVITWEQVQEKLGAKDIAVEFVSFPLNADSTMYIAYALKKDWKCPKMIPLFEEKQLLAVQKWDRYTIDSISRLVWKPLDEVMQGVENVYFAPSGELYNIAIESIPTHEDGGQTLVGEHRDYYRLSSTRELALIRNESRWDEAAIYGGLRYDMSVKGMIDDDGKHKKATGQKRGDSTPSYYLIREDDIGRGYRDHAQGLKYLEGTKREADSITHYLEQRSVDARLFTDSIGTETSFKALGGKKTSIIHIGTHGFFNDREKEYKEDKLQLLGMDNQSRVVEDDALTRSGLYFAGADNVILNGQSAVPDSIDDGRLTAAEIAQLDLRGLDMVVLSACQTGLGEITGDGVFGLQRGFKKAGAQTIVMSLWNVNDDATTEFMTKFFESIETDAHGHPLNKQQAFRIAQQHLRDNKEKYPEDPNCWAAFVMLDGVD